MTEKKHDDDPLAAFGSSGPSVKPAGIDQLAKSAVAPTASGKPTRKPLSERAATPSPRERRMPRPRPPAQPTRQLTARVAPEVHDAFYRIADRHPDLSVGRVLAMIIEKFDE